MSGVYFLEVIEAKKEKEKVCWFYEGKDLFSKEGSEGLVKGDEVVKELFELLEKGFTVVATSKDGKVTNFSSSKDLLVYCFSNQK